MPDSAEHRSQRLAVVSPLANERGTIDEFVRRVLAQIGEDDRLIVVFDSACTDGTVDRARELAAREPRLVVVFAPENRSVVDAYFRGYREALAGGFDWILEMDGGLSHVPEEIPRFVDAMRKGYDYAGGCRFTDGGSFDGPWSRYLLSRGGTWLTNFLIGTRMPDMTSGFECFTRGTLERVVDEGVESRAHFFQTEIRALMHEVRWVDVPINYACPSDSVGKSSIADAFRSLRALYRRQAAKKRAIA